ncbi:MAG: hypothetical protein QM737_18605 [Ferruginibacter sp.]
MSILSPNKINTTGRVIMTYSKSFDYTDPILKVKLSKKIAMISISQKSFNEHKSVDLEAFIFSPDEEQILTYVAMQSLIKTCSDNAEDIKDRLLSINLQLYPLTKDEREEIIKMDLMKLKDRFMEFLKQDQLLKTIDDYSSNQKLKPFRKDFDAFVLDRNIYTHGLLNILRPDFDFVIEYIDNSSKGKAHAYITPEILISYNNFYKEITKLIAAFHETRKIGRS